MDIKNITEAKAFKGFLAGLGFFIIILIIFQAGVFVGYRKAAYSYRFGDNFYRNFQGGRPGLFRPDLPGGHGAVGRIVKIEGNNILVDGPDKFEKLVTIKKNTIIRRFRDTIKISDLKVGDMVVIIGSPNDRSEIEAELIRVMPSNRVATSTP